MSLEEIKQLAWKFIDEIFNKGNINEADILVTPEFIYHARGEDIEGLESSRSGFYQILVYFRMSGLH